MKKKRIVILSLLFSAIFNVMAFSKGLDGVVLTLWSEYSADPKIVCDKNGTIYNAREMLSQTSNNQICNNNDLKSDIHFSLDQLEPLNVEYVMVFFLWYQKKASASDNPDDFEIRPMVDLENNNNMNFTVPWSAGGLSRSEVEATQSSYGGTPSDASLIWLVQELQSRGYKVIFQPVVAVDDVEESDHGKQGKQTWRGFIDPFDSEKYFTGDWGYNNLYLYYAKLLKQHNISPFAFILGSEMKTLTAQGAPDFPNVKRLKYLASKVKNILPDARLSYGANFDEYHHIGDYYHLDSLWADTNIDFVGISAYFPLTCKKTDNFNIIKNSWSSGPAYHYISCDNQEVIDPAWAIKNLDYWWSNLHYNVGEDTPTEWIPKQKPICFLEFGFPSSLWAPIAPNIFPPNSLSDETNEVSETTQSNCIRASLVAFEEMPFLDFSLLYLFDTRPYPAFPIDKAFWLDSPNWDKGHWFNGKKVYYQLSSYPILTYSLENIGTYDLYIPCVQFLDYFFNLSGKIEYIENLNSLVLKIANTEEIEFANPNCILSMLDEQLNLSIQNIDISNLNSNSLYELSAINANFEYIGEQNGDNLWKLSNIENVK